MPKPRTPAAADTKPPSRTLLHDHVVDRICRLAGAMTQLSSRDIEERWGLRHTDLRLLSVLDGGARLAVNEISRRTLVDQAWVSRSLRALEGQKLVQRSRDPADSRLALISLSRRGRDVMEEFRPHAVWTQQLLLEGIDEARLKSQLDRIAVNTENLRQVVEGTPREPRGKKR